MPRTGAGALSRLVRVGLVPFNFDKQSWPPVPLSMPNTVRNTHNNGFRCTCIQEELPSQEELRLVGKNGFMPYKSTAELIQRALNG